MQSPDATTSLRARRLLHALVSIMLGGSALATSVAGEATEPAPQFAVSLQDGQRISGTLPAELRVTTRFGEFRVPIDRLESINPAKEQLAFHLMNGDILQGSVTGAFKLQSTFGPEIDLASAGLEGLQRAASSLHTHWSEAHNHLRARLRLLEAPSGRRGELTLLVELQNTGKETLRLLKPNLNARVLSPKDLGRQDDYNAWITAQFERVGREHAQELRVVQALRNGPHVHILPGGTYRLHITIPFEVERTARHEELEKMVEAVGDLQKPVRERTHFFGTETMEAQTGTGRFRVFYHVPENGGEADKNARWSGSVVTPTLAIPFPDRP